METDRQKIDLHRLDMRFAATRVADPPAIERLARSIEQNGQIVACIAVASRSEAEIRRAGHQLRWEMKQ
jgi:ParB-like chromosome segregation protein Spo0J